MKGNNLHRVVYVIIYKRSFESFMCLDLILLLLLLPEVSVPASTSRWLAECCFTSTETVGLLGTGAQDGYIFSVDYK